MATHITIPDVDSDISYTVVSATRGPFVFNFPYFASTDILVYVDDDLQTLTDDYTVTGSGAVTGGFTGGRVNFVANIDHCVVTIERDLPIERTSDFPASGPLNIPSLNTQLDKFVAMIQQVRRSINNGLNAAAAAGQAAASAVSAASAAAAAALDRDAIEALLEDIGSAFAIDTDPEMEADSDLFAPSQRAVRTYISNTLSTLPCFRATKGGTNQTAIPSGVATPVTFNTESFDNGGGYNTALGRWTPGVTGTSAISINIQLGGTNLVDQGPFTLSVFKNGTIFSSASRRLSGTSSQGLTHFDLVPHDDDDYFEVSVLIGTADPVPPDGLDPPEGDKTILGGVTQAYWSGHVILVT